MTRIKFTTACQDAPDVLSSDFGQPRAVTHGRSASVPYPREDGGTTICDTQADVPSARRLGAQLAFKDSMVHGILQFTPSIAFRYVLHRCKSLDIRCRESFYINVSKHNPHGNRLRCHADVLRAKLNFLDAFSVGV